jgi:hypothetical protein
MASTSPLLPYQNARLLLPGQGTVSVVDGRLVAAPADSYLVRLFIKRAQYSGVSSGSKKLPLESQLDGRMMPGASGDQFYYRGYALDFTTVAGDYDLDTGDETGFTWTQVTTQYDWLATGTECVFRFGQDPIMYGAKIQRSSGVFGGQGIDEILYSEIGGVEIQITGAELQN